jgi:hypothetical protein
VLQSEKATKAAKIAVRRKLEREKFKFRKT